VTILTLAAGDYRIRISPQGGTIVDGTHRGIPIFRPYPDAGSRAIDPLKCGSFPLVPFGNRVEGNRFSHAGRTYELQPNTDWDRHYLHGDGWLKAWTLVEADAASALMRVDVRSAVYIYAAEQRFALTEEGLGLTLRVRNRGEHAMPFGLGHHPFFPLTPQTRLFAPATAFWSEKHDYLPDRRCGVPAELDYAQPRRLPERWINNGFEGWSGLARIEWPERHLALDLSAPHCSRYFLFRSDTTFDPGFKGDFFCFEPMTHSASAHGRDDGGLVVLKPGEALTLQFRMQAAVLIG
jgi:aldose 1-epimerase